MMLTWSSRVLSCGVCVQAQGFSYARLQDPATPPAGRQPWSGMGLMWASGRNPRAWIDGRPLRDVVDRQRGD
jgi:hypothetical protein